MITPKLAVGFTSCQLSLVHLYSILCTFPIIGLYNSMCGIFSPEPGHTHIGKASLLVLHQAKVFMYNSTWTYMHKFLEAISISPWYFKRLFALLLICTCTCLSFYWKWNKDQTFFLPNKLACITIPSLYPTNRQVYPCPCNIFSL